MDRQQTTEFIENEFDVQGETLWKKFPFYTVFRNRRNKKWFAIIMDIEKSKLGLKGEGKTDIIDIKCDPLLIGSLLRSDGFLPAYHMAKKSWITVLLDGTVKENELKDLIRLSFEITDRK